MSLVICFHETYILVVPSSSTRFKIQFFDNKFAYTYQKEIKFADNAVSFSILFTYQNLHPRTDNCYIFYIRWNSLRVLYVDSLVYHVASTVRENVLLR